MEPQPRQPYGGWKYHSLKSLLWDADLQKKIKNTEFYENETIEFASENTLMLAVDNMKGGLTEIRNNKRTLERIFERCFPKIKVPASWFALSLYIRSLERRMLSLEECQQLASEVGIDKEELQHVLWFLHYHMGVILYFPQVKALKSTVIRDMQVLFDSATHLIKNTFTFEKVGKQEYEEFMGKGKFSLKNIPSKEFSYHNLIPLEELIELLKHLNMITAIPSSEGVDPTYFMPCVLKSARSSELATACTEQDPAPLLIRYDCGYVPTGLFTSMIVRLTSQLPEGWEICWDELRKNRVQFTVGIMKDCDTLTLLQHPRFIEIALKRDHESEFCVPTEGICADIRSIIKSTLNHKATCLKKFTMGYKFGFRCPIHPDDQHLSILQSEEAIKM